MLENVFADLYDSGILLFLDTSNYIENTVDFDILNKRKTFFENYSEPVVKGYIYTFTTDLESILSEINEDSCAVIKYGFESDTDEKAEQVGMVFIEILTKYGFLKNGINIKKILENKCLSIVLDKEDVKEKQNKLLTLINS